MNRLDLHLTVKRRFDLRFDKKYSRISAVGHDMLAVLVSVCLEVVVSDETLFLGYDLSLLSSRACRTTDVECSKSQLCTRLTDRLCRNDTHSLTNSNHMTACKIDSVTECTDTAFTLTCRRSSDDSGFDTCFGNDFCFLFIDKCTFGKEDLI